MARSWTGCPRLIGFAAAMALCACATPEHGRASPGRRGDDGSKLRRGPPASNTMRVGNQAKGVEEQPDYDRHAIEIQEQVHGRLPDPLPAPRAACVAMLDAAMTRYRDDERAKKTLQATRDAELAACVKETSAAAASCVAVLVAQGDTGEFPWLLDQCSRAFPS